MSDSRNASVQDTNSIWSAARDGDDIRVKELLEIGMDPNDVSGIDSEIKPDSKGEYISPIEIAVYNYHINAVKRLADHPMIKHDSILQVIRIVILRENSELKKFFLAPRFVNIQAKNGLTPLCMAAMFYDIEFLTALLENGANPNLPGTEPLTIAVMNASNSELQVKANAVIQQLLTNGASPDNFTIFSHSPLGYVMRHRNMDGFRLILPCMKQKTFIISNAMGNVREVPWYSWYLSNVFTWPGPSNLEQLELLVKHGADINDNIDTYKKTILEKYSATHAATDFESFRSLLDCYEFILNLGAGLFNNYNVTNKPNPIEMLSQAHMRVIELNPTLSKIDPTFLALEKRYQEIIKRLEAIAVVYSLATCKREYQSVVTVLKHAGSPLHRRQGE